MRVGIDGSNLRQGGGVTHLVQLLQAADPEASGIERVTVWGARALLDVLPERRWLARAHDAALEGNALSRFWWQEHRLAARTAQAADVLFSPGGTYLGAFHPFVTMFRNMLPFDASERRQYGMSRMRLKLELLRRAQAATFRRADGVIFLTEHARAAILHDGVKVRGRQAVIPHGLDSRFFNAETAARPLDTPFRWLYVSAIHRYKHPWNVAEAVATLRNEGLPLSLNIVGPAYPAAGARLLSTVARLDPRGAFISIAGGRAHEDLPALYHGADGFVFASTCENMPNSLLEAMAARLPIACSDRPPMPEILQDGGVYCDPQSPASIADAMRRLMMDAPLRARLAETAQARARVYSWERCARQTFDFLAEIGQSR
jgi:glycosyltransferase involved in cell wall biosynthesis